MGQRNEPHACVVYTCGVMQIGCLQGRKNLSLGSLVGSGEIGRNAARGRADGICSRGQRPQNDRSSIKTNSFCALF